jgi:hypothetical protein
VERFHLPAGCALLACCAAALLCGAGPLDRISADSLRTNVTWLAADERAGRLTPSPGLEASADYIAAQFRRAGLTPGGGDGSYFQTALFTQIRPVRTDLRLTLQAGNRTANVDVGSVNVESLAGLDYRDEDILRLPRTGPMPAVAGRLVIGDASYAAEAALRALESRKPSVILLVFDGTRPEDAVPVLIEAGSELPPVVRIYSKAAAGLLAGRSEIRLTMHAAPPQRADVRLRNVAGILRGSDPAVRDRFVILSAHYDHLGVKPDGPGDRIYNGANDNASGTASVIEIAKALSASPKRPRRSVLFLAVFGEEEGLLGSYYYVHHPLIPLARTIADINLEQLGRTDSSDGEEIARFAFTGPSYSSLPGMVSGAAKSEGTEVYRRDGDDDYFDRSDNYAFALAGIVAHTAVVAFEFADYHAVSDETGKIDFANLARVDRGIAAGLLAVANAAEPPKWSDTRAARTFRDARGKDTGR